MEQQNVILESQTVLQDLEVIGQGGMIYKPCQIGEWWVMPAEMYTGTIPPDIMAKWNRFKALNVPVLGYLIADDMREVQLKREKEAEEKRAIEQRQRSESFNQNVQQIAEVGGQVLGSVGKVIGAVAIGAAMLTAGMLLAVLRFDPILIAVLPDGRWVCLGAWWD